MFDSSVMKIMSAHMSSVGQSESKGYCSVLQNLRKLLTQAPVSYEVHTKGGVRLDFG